MVTGSVASSIHGVPRSTNDLDVVIAPSGAQLSALVQLFNRLGLYVDLPTEQITQRRQDQFNVIDFKNSLKADLIFRKTRDFSVIEFDRREIMDSEGFNFFIARPEDVIISKLEWSKIGDSERQLRDAAGIVQMQGDKLDLAYVEQWVEALGLREQWSAAQAMAG